MVGWLSVPVTIARREQKGQGSTARWLAAFGGGYLFSPITKNILERRIVSCLGFEERRFFAPYMNSALSAWAGSLRQPAKTPSVQSTLKDAEKTQLPTVS